MSEIHRLGWGFGCSQALTRTWSDLIDRSEIAAVTADPAARIDARCDLIIPARNEAENLPSLAAALAPLREQGVVRRVVLCDNGSTDATADLARAAGFDVVHEPRPGYGGACLTGIAWLQDADDPPSVVAFLDADLSDDPRGLADLVRPVVDDHADLVIGCRPALAEPGALDPHQRFGNRLACWLLRLATGHRWSDLGPMRAVRWSSLFELEMVDRTWGWTVEMQYKAITRGLRVMEVDVPYRCRHAGTSKISGSLVGSFKAGRKIITTICGLWWHEKKPE